MDADIYVVDGEKLNIATVRYNIWSLISTLDIKVHIKINVHYYKNKIMQIKEQIISFKNKEIKQSAAYSKSKKTEICWSAEKWHPCEISDLIIP